MKTFTIVIVSLMIGCMPTAAQDKKEESDAKPPPDTAKVEKEVKAEKRMIFEDSKLDQPGTAKIEKEVTFKASFDKVVQTFKKHRDEIREIPNTKIVSRKDDKVRMEFTTSQGFVTYFTLQEREGRDEEKQEAFFQSRIVETDGFITRQDTLIVLTEKKEGKSLAKISVHLVCPEIPSIILRMEVNRQVQSMVKKVKKLLNEK